MTRTKEIVTWLYERSASESCESSPPVRSKAGRLHECVCVTTRLKGKATERQARTCLHHDHQRRHLLLSPPRSPSRRNLQPFVMQPFILLALLLPVGMGMASKSNLPPRFTTDPNGPGSEIVVVVKEGPESVGKEMLRVAGEDPDGDELTFGVQAPAGNELIKIVNHVPSRNSAVIYLNKELDRETKDSYSLVLTLTDGKLGTDKFVSIPLSSYSLRPHPPQQTLARSFASVVTYSHLISALKGLTTGSTFGAGMRPFVTRTVPSVRDRIHIPAESVRCQKENLLFPRCRIAGLLEILTIILPSREF